MKNLCVFRFLISSCSGGARRLAQVTSFPKPSYFRETFSKTVTKVELQPPVRLQDYVVGRASWNCRCKSYLELVMANNTDIAIQRLTVDMAQERHHAGVSRRSIRSPPAASPAHAVQDAQPPTHLAGRHHSGHAEPAGALQLHPDAAERHQLSASALARMKSSTNSGFHELQSRHHFATSAVNFTQPLLKNRGAYINRLPITHRPQPAAQDRIRPARHACCS